MGLFNQASERLKRPRGSSADGDKIPEDTEDDDTSILYAFRESSPTFLLPYKQ